MVRSRVIKFRSKRIVFLYIKIRPFYGCVCGGKDSLPVAQNDKGEWLRIAVWVGLWGSRVKPLLQIRDSPLSLSESLKFV